MKTNKITLVSNNLNIKKTKQNNKNNNLNTSFKGANHYLPQIGQKTVQSMWNKLFPKLQKGLVKTTYMDLIPTQSNGYASKEIKYYYRKSKDNLLLKTIRNCTLNQDKQIEKATEICYHYDTSEKGGLQQKIIINPEFDNNNQLKKADCVYDFYNQDDKKQAVIHKGVEFKDDSIISSRSSEFIYNDGEKEHYEDTLMDENGEIYNFAKKESTFSYEEGAKSITQKKIWFDSNFSESTPDVYMSTVNEPGQPEKKIYIEEPVFRDDTSIQSARLSQKVTDGTAYTYYNSTYDKDGCLESSELSRVTNIDSYNKAKKLRKTISDIHSLSASTHDQIKNLEERQKELSMKYTELEKQYQDEYELRINERRSSYKPTIAPEQKTLGIKDLLKIYENKSENKEQEQPIETTKPKQTSSRIKDLLNIYKNKSENKEQEQSVETTRPKQISSKIKDLLKIYENKSESKSESKQQEQPVETTKPKTIILPKVEENRSKKTEEAKSKTTLLLESLKSIEQEKEELQIQIAQLKAVHSKNMKKYLGILSKLNRLMSQDIVYDKDKKQKIIAQASASFDNTINEKFQFRHKELIEHE